MYRSHTHTYMHTFNIVHPKYTFEAVKSNYTFESVGPLHARCIKQMHTRTCIRT